MDALTKAVIKTLRAAEVILTHEGTPDGQHRTQSLRPAGRWPLQQSMRGRED